MRFAHLYCLLALLGQTTATALVFAQGPIIDSDPAPGRSPGPPVNYSPAPLSGKKDNWRRLHDKIEALQRVEEGVATASSAVANTPTTHTPPAIVASPTSASLLSTAVDDNNYNGSSSARRSSAAGRETPASGDGSTTSGPVDEQNNLSRHRKSNNNDKRRAKQRDDEERVEEVQNHQNDKTTKDMRQGISQKSKKRSTLDGKSLAGDTLNNTSRSSSTSVPPVPVNDARTSPSEFENNQRVSKNTNPGPSLRNRRNTPSSQSSNKVTTMATAKAPQEAIERIAVATVESSIGSSRIMADEDDDWGTEDVNLFCGGDTPLERKERQRSYASEPDDVLVKLPSSELFSGSSQSGAEGDVSAKDPVAVITTNEDVSGAPATTKSVAENVKVGARAGVDPAATGYPDQSPSISTVGVVTTSSPPPPPTAPAFLSASGDSKSQGSRAQGDDLARDHGVPVFVDVTHDDFDSRFGLVAGIEYRGKRKATTGWVLNYLCILC